MRYLDIQPKDQEAERIASELIADLQDPDLLERVVQALQTSIRRMTMFKILEEKNDLANRQDHS